MTRALAPKSRPPLAPDLLDRVDAYWRAANYLSVGQIYLLDNPLLKRAAQARAHQAAAARPLGHHAGAELHLRPPQPGHQGARPGHDLRRRPGPRRPGHRRQRLPRRDLQRGLSRTSRQDEDGMQPAVQAVLLPRRHPQPRRARRRPGSIHEGGELGYCARPRLRRRVRQPGPDRRLRRRRRRGGDRRRWPTSWHSNKFLNPVRDGAVLPILHLNGYKIASPTVLARIPHEELEQLLARLRLRAVLRRRATSRRRCTSSWPATLDAVFDEIRQHPAPTPQPNGFTERPRWPMIVLRSPKGWTGPKEVDGKPIEGTWRSHQVPLAEMATKPGARQAARSSG